MRRFGLVVVGLAGVIVASACGQGDSGSTEEFVALFTEHGDSAYSFDSLDEAVSEAYVVIRGRIVDVERIVDSDGIESDYLVIAIDETLVGKLAQEDIESQTIRVGAHRSSRSTLEEIRRAIPDEGIDGVHFLCYGPTILGRIVTPPSYIHMNDYVLALRGTDGSAIGYESPQISLRYFGGPSTTFEDVVSRTEDAATRFIDGGSVKGPLGVCEPRP